MTLWGGRFTTATNELMRRFSDSIGFDRRMYGADIRGSVAYAGALARAGLITSEERDQLVAGLEQVRVEFDAGTFRVQESDEDIHTAVERRLGELVGPVAGKLHTGRSRNDQVATDLRLYLLDEMAVLREALIELQGAIVEKAAAHLDVIMPGYTHLQQAQPLLFSHWLMAFFWKLERDRERLNGAARRTQVCPLGSGALAGNPLGIDRRALAADLGFAAVSENSVDAVEDRDYVVEFLAWAALVQVHLSRLAENLIVWSSQEFGFVELDEAYATGSSLMPQKKNPDPLELMRGKTGRMVGHLVGLLTTLKGLPSAYNKDLQEDDDVEGAALGLQQGPAGGQGGGLRRDRHTEGGAAHRRGSGAHAAGERGPHGRRAGPVHAGHRPGRLPSAQGSALPREPPPGRSGGAAGRRAGSVPEGPRSGRVSGPSPSLRRGRVRGLRFPAVGGGAECGRGHGTGSRAHPDRAGKADQQINKSANQRMSKSVNRRTIRLYTRRVNQWLRAQNVQQNWTWLLTWR
jgi:argininosuccinate lyase